jgi:hypothetical protein
VDSSKIWLALTVLAHPIAALNATDGYSILLAPEVDNTESDESISVSEGPAEQEQSIHANTDNNMKAAQPRRKGLHDFACFQYSDSLVPY